MTTTTSPPPSSWTRFIPKQFSLRTLLALITIAGVLTWWLYDPRLGYVTELQVLRFRDRMVQSEVVSLLGKPLRRDQVPEGEIWHYKIVDPFDGDHVGSLRILVEPDGGKASLMFHEYTGKRLLK